MASVSQLQTLKDEGFFTMENFLSEDEIESLKKACRGIIDEMNPEDHAHTVFKTDDQMKSAADEYFLTSGDKIRFFFEEGVFGDDGQLKTEKHHSLNKIGHALHFYTPEFRRITFGDKMKDLARSLGLVDPSIPQSMYIFKQPRCGGKVIAHQDSTFLFTTPLKLTGFWIALEDATLENGCLSFIPGSHKEGVHEERRMIRNKAWSPGSKEPTCIFTGEPVDYKESEFIPVEVKKGTLVVLNGQVVHKSEKNVSDKSRHIYTFHLYDADGSQWSAENWLQPTQQLPFPRLYQTSPEL